MFWLGFLLGMWVGSILGLVLFILLNSMPKDV